MEEKKITAKLMPDKNHSIESIQDTTRLTGEEILSLKNGKTYKHKFNINTKKR